MEKELEKTNNVININDDNIKFKAIQYFSDPPMMMLFSKLKTGRVDDYKQLVLMKRIREALGKEGLIIDESIKEIRERYISELPKGEEPSQFEINVRVNTFLRDQDVFIPFPKLKLSTIKGIESLSDIDTFEGIIEFDIE
jgi:hypothetical protein